MPAMMKLISITTIVSSVFGFLRRILKRRGGGRNFKKLEKNKDQNKKLLHPKSTRFSCPKFGEEQKKGLHSNLVRFFCPKLGEEQKKRFSLKFSPTICPKFGADQKQTSSPTLCVLKASAQLTKGGGHAAILHTNLC